MKSIKAKTFVAAIIAPVLIIAALILFLFDLKVLIMVLAGIFIVGLVFSLAVVDGVYKNEWLYDHPEKKDAQNTE